MDFFTSQDNLHLSCGKNNSQELTAADLNLRLTQGFPEMMKAGSGLPEKRRAETPSLNSEESGTTSLESGSAYHQRSLPGERETKVFRLFF
jgi:hypothetical protein